MRRDLADEAMRLGRVLAGLLPREPEVHGLVALMELQASRFDARGDGVLLQDQDRRFWDSALIEHGLRALDRAIDAGHARSVRTRCRRRSPRATAGPGRSRTTDWEAIVALYDALAQLTPVAGGRAQPRGRGPARRRPAGGARRPSTRSAATRGIARYHLLGAVRADVLARLGRTDEAADELERAAALAPTQRERNLLHGAVGGRRGIARARCRR